MTDLRLVATQLRLQLISVGRNRRAMVLGAVFPAVLLVMFNSVFASDSGTVQLAGAEVTANAYFTGGMLAYAIVTSGFSQQAMTLVAQRESGQLKRLRGTPVPAWTFVLATVLRVTVMGLAIALVLLAIAHFGYGVGVSSAALGEVLLYVLLGTATTASLALVATSIATDVDSVGAALPLATVVLALISGVFVPVDQLPSWLAEVARIFPLYHLAAGLQTALGVAGRTGLHAGDIAVLCAWALWGTIFAARHFSWVPRAGAAR